MKSIELKAFARKSTGKKESKLLRRQKMVPCVLYGGKENLHFYTEERSFKDLVYTPHVYLVNLDIEGKKYQAVMKELQFHPVTDGINHIDFYEVNPKVPLTIDIPVELTGSSIGVRAGGKLRQRKRLLKVKGLITNIPDSIVIDITNMEIGQSVLAGDLKYNQLEILEAPRALVVGVLSARAVVKDAEEGTAGAAAAGAEGAATEASADSKK
jgi:large subunit ribosomal protein L25